MKSLLRWSLLLLVLGAPLAGCAKRATQAPPALAPAPPATPGTTPVPSEQPPAQPSTPSAPGAAEIVAQLQPAFFDYDASSLNEAARAALDTDARILREHGTVRVVVEGHCDERGTAEYNQALGERRAMAARDYLIAAGIDASRLTVISYGKERPFETGSDEASYARNRRAHFTAR